MSLNPTYFQVFMLLDLSVTFNCVDHFLLEETSFLGFMQSVHLYFFVSRYSFNVFICRLIFLYPDIKCHEMLQLSWPACGPLPQGLCTCCSSAWCALVSLPDLISRMTSDFCKEGFLDFLNRVRHPSCRCSQCSAFFFLCWPINFVLIL